jgi:hypothetical protein
MNKIILEQPWGGLGDNLQFSTLPELCHENEIDFYLSVNNSYRNEDIKKLVWDNNPFVKGIINEPPNGGTIKMHDYLGLLKFDYSYIGAIEKAHGFEPKNNLPKIYYQPKNLEFFNDKTVLCLGSISETFDNDYIINNVKNLLDNNDDVIELNFIKDLSELNKTYGTHKQYKTSYEKYDLKDIFEHCDIIYSAKKYICLFSGNSVLSAAINKKNTYVLTKHENLDISKFYYFENLNYIKLC